MASSLNNVDPLSGLFEDMALDLACHEAASSGSYSWVPEVDTASHQDQSAFPGLTFSWDQSWEMSQHFAPPGTSKEPSPNTKRRPRRRRRPAGTTTRQRDVKGRFSREPMRPSLEEVKSLTPEKLVTPQTDLPEEEALCEKCTSTYQPKSAAPTPRYKNPVSRKKVLIAQYRVEQLLEERQKEEEEEYKQQEAAKARKEESLKEERAAEKVLEQEEEEEADDSRLFIDTRSINSSPAPQQHPVYQEVTWPTRKTSRPTSPQPSTSRMEPRTSTPLIPSSPPEDDHDEERPDSNLSVRTKRRMICTVDGPATSDESDGSSYVPLADRAAADDSGSDWSGYIDVVNFTPPDNGELSSDEEEEVIDIADLSDFSDEGVAFLDSDIEEEQQEAEVQIIEEWQWRGLRDNEDMEVRELTFKSTKWF